MKNSLVYYIEETIAFCVVTALTPVVWVLRMLPEEKVLYETQSWEEEQRGR